MMNILLDKVNRSKINRYKYRLTCIILCLKFRDNEFLYTLYLLLKIC